MATCCLTSSHRSAFRLPAFIPGDCRDPPREEHSLHHVRPAACRPPVVLRPSHAEDAEPRCAGRARRDLRPRLRQLAGLRPLAHELLHRPLRAGARRQLELRATQGWRDDNRRPPAAAGRALGAGGQDPHAGRPGRHVAPGHRSTFADWRADQRVRLRPLRARRRYPSLLGP